MCVLHANHIYCRLYCMSIIYIVDQPYVWIVYTSNVCWCTWDTPADRHTQPPTHTHTHTAFSSAEKSCTITDTPYAPIHTNPYTDLNADIKYKCIYTYIQIYIYIHTYIHIGYQVQVHIYIHTYIYIYIHTYISDIKYKCMHLRISCFAVVPRTIESSTMTITCPSHTWRIGLNLHRTCEHVCIYLCEYAHMHVRWCSYMYVCLHVCMYDVALNLCKYIVHVCACMHV
jgi:hypothetical protein